MILWISKKGISYKFNAKVAWGYAFKTLRCKWNDGAAVEYGVATALLHFKDECVSIFSILCHGRVNQKHTDNTTIRFWTACYFIFVLQTKFVIKRRMWQNPDYQLY